MYKSSLSKKMLLPGILIIISIILSSCSGNDGGKIGPLVTINLQFSELPKLNQVVNLKISISTPIPINNIQAQLLLPNGFTLVSGEAEWGFDLDANQSYETEVVVMANTLGESQIQVDATGQQDTAIIGNKKIIYINVLTDTADVSIEPFIAVPTSNGEATSTIR
ncbi:MAG: hypothetical protein HZB50_17575 [Chloroflexi bacterium]|nr:hypothetical protein [Chloroflexota bacterium]